MGGRVQPSRFFPRNFHLDVTDLPAVPNQVSLDRGELEFLRKFSRPKEPAISTLTDPRHTRLRIRLVRSGIKDRGKGIGEWPAGGPGYAKRLVKSELRDELVIRASVKDVAHSQSTNVKFYIFAHVSKIAFTLPFSFPFYLPLRP